MAGASKKARKDERKGRPQLTIRFNSKTDVEHIKQAAKAASISVNQYCVERILLSRGYRDPIYELSSRLLGAANVVSRDLFLASELIRETTKLRLAVAEHESTAGTKDPDLQAVIKNVNEAVGELLASNEARADTDQAIARAAQEIAMEITNRNVAKQSSSSVVWGKPKS